MTATVTVTPSATEPDKGMSPAAVKTADEPEEVTSAETADMLLLPDSMMAADESVMELSPDDTMALVEPTQMPTVGSEFGMLHSSAGYSETRLLGSVP